MSNSENTRNKILAVAANEIHQHGFAATSLSVILKQCEISKGALYHHFANKLELGYAVFEEIFVPDFLGTWQPALSAEDPIEALCELFTSFYQEHDYCDIACGCPINNLCQEMAPVDEGFRLRISAKQQQLHKMFIEAFERVSAQLRDDLNYSQVALFIFASLNGASNMIKSSSEIDLFKEIMIELCRYLRSLKK